MSFSQTDTFAVRGYECDASGRMSVPALMNLMQESANRNALDYGIGIAQLAQRGFGWMLMRFRLRVHQYPQYGQLIQLTTYPTTVDKYFIHRDFQVVSEEGSRLADATSIWLVFGMEKRAMVPLPDFIRQLTPPAGIDPLPQLPLKPAFQTALFNPDYETDIRVGWRSIDQNQHVNNVAYVEWLLESMPEQTLQTQQLVELDIVYRAESHWLDQLQVQQASEAPAVFRHRIVQSASGKDVLLARSQWKSR